VIANSSSKKLDIPLRISRLKSISTVNKKKVKKTKKSQLLEERFLNFNCYNTNITTEVDESKSIVEEGDDNFFEETDIDDFYNQLQLIEKILKKFITKEIIDIREARKKTIFIEIAIQKILINYIKIKFSDNKNKFNKMFSIIYSLHLKDFYEINLNVDAIVLKKVFKECWSFFYPNNLQLNGEEIIEILTCFDSWQKSFVSISSYNNTEDNNATPIVPFKQFCVWFVTDVFDNMINSYTNYRFKKMKINV
jgi:hypothetical protein